MPFEPRHGPGARRVRPHRRGRRAPRGRSPPPPATRPAPRRPRRGQGPDRRRRAADRARAGEGPRGGARRRDRRAPAGGRRGDRRQDAHGRARPRRAHAGRERPARRRAAAPAARAAARRSRSPPAPRCSRSPPTPRAARGSPPPRAASPASAPPPAGCPPTGSRSSPPASTASASSRRQPKTSPSPGPRSAARSASRPTRVVTLADDQLGRVEPDRLEAAREAAHHLSPHPLELATPSLPQFGPPRATAIGAEAVARHDPRDAESAAARAQLEAAAQSDADVRAARARLDELGAALREAVGDGVLVTPTLPSTPPLWEELQTTDAQLRATGRLTRLCGPVNSSGPRRRLDAAGRAARRPQHRDRARRRAPPPIAIAFRTIVTKSFPAPARRELERPRSRSTQGGSTHGR